MPDTTTVTATTTEQTPVDLVRAELAAAMAVDASGKPGWKSTEFWTHLVVLILGGALIIYGLSHDANVAMEMGTALVGVDSAAYKIARGMAKAPPKAA